MSLFKRTGLAITALFVLSGCILVDHFGKAWDSAKPDACLNKIAQSLYAGEFSRDPSGYEIADLARAITLEGQNFLLLKKSPDDKGGRLYRFRVTNGIFERFRLVPTMRARFEQDYPDAPVHLNRDTVSIENLEDAPRKLLIEIAKKPEYWEVEDKTLYNTLHNPACRFEDRDLSKLDTPEGKK